MGPHEAEGVGPDEWGGRCSAAANAEEFIYEVLWRFFRFCLNVSLLPHFLRRNPISGKFHANVCSFTMISEGQNQGEKVFRWSLRGRIYARQRAFTRPSFFG